MLNDINLKVVDPVDNAEQARVADDKARLWVADMERAQQEGELVVECLLHTLGPATCEMAMELAQRADRAQYGAQVPVGDKWGEFGEKEETQVGFMMVKWLRRRLPKAHE